MDKQKNNQNTLQVTVSEFECIKQILYTNGVIVDWEYLSENNIIWGGITTIPLKQ